jgi:hypothetical protein
MRTASIKFAMACFLAVAPAMAQTHDAPSTNGPSVTQAQQFESFVHATETIRANCINGRRIVCGRILKILPDGFVVDSGYTNLMQPPLNRSWLVPGTVQALRDPHLVEGNEPASVCVGKVFLTDTPKSRRTKPGQYDYVVIEAYPDGSYTYTSLGTIQHTLRRFSASLETAIVVNRTVAGIQPPAFLSEKK